MRWNSLLIFFVLICTFGLLCAVNSRLSGVRFVLVARYSLRYFLVSCPMKVGCLPNLPFSFSSGMFILYDVCSVFRSSMSFIWSCFIAHGLSPDCAIRM